MAEVGNLLAQFGNRPSILQQVDEMKAQQTMNRLREMQMATATDAMQREAASREAYANALGGDKSAVQTLARNSPELHGQYLKNLSTMREDQRALLDEQMAGFAAQLVAAGNDPEKLARLGLTPEQVPDAMNRLYTYKSAREIVMAQGKAPTVRDFTVGDRTVSAQWDPSAPDTGLGAGWRTIAEGPRYKPESNNGGDGPMSVQEWEYYNRLSPQDQERYLTMKRSNRLYDVGGSLVGVTQTTGERTTGIEKTLPPQDTPEVRGAQAAAVATSEATAKRDFSMAAVPELVTEARSILTGKVKPTGSGLGTAYDYAGSLVGFSPTGASEADQLRTVSAALVSKMPRFEGPQSDADRQYYIEEAGRVGDSTIPVARRQKALATVEKLWGKYGKPQPPASVPSAGGDTSARVGQVITVNGAQYRITKLSPDGDHEVEAVK